MKAIYYSICCSLLSLFAIPQVSAQDARDSIRFGSVGSDLNGKSGGNSVGFSGTWVGNTSFDIGAGSLTDPTGTLSIYGNRVTAQSYSDNRDISRLFSNAFGTDNTTEYFSFLIRPEGILGQGAYGGWFGFVLDGSQNAVLVGRPTSESRYAIERPGGTNRVFTTKTTAIGESVFFTLRIDFHAGNDDIRLYVNPVPGSSEPASAAATISAFDLGFLTDVRLSGPGAFSIDEIQAGPTFSSVTRPMLPGDFNGNDSVDALDFATWQSNFATATGGLRETGDADNDGDIDGADFIIWQTHFPSTLSATTAVPEPSAFLLAMLTLPAIGYKLVRCRRCSAAH